MRRRMFKILPQKGGIAKDVWDALENAEAVDLARDKDGWARVAALGQLLNMPESQLMSIISANPAHFRTEGVKVKAVIPTDR